MIIALKKASTPFTVMPTMRKGSSISQINGYSKRASIANGQQSTKRISQSSNLIKHASFMRILIPFNKMSSFIVNAACCDGMTWVV